MKSTEETKFDGLVSSKFSLRRSSRAICPVCDKQVDLITFEHAAELFHTDLQDINFLAAGGQIHQIHNRKGKLMICAGSLFDCFDNRRTRLLDSGIIKEIAAEKAAGTSVGTAP